MMHLAGPFVSQRFPSPYVGRDRVGGYMTERGGR
jgi:hypothetical protein